MFGLKGLTPLRDAVRPPYRPDPTRRRGRPHHDELVAPTESVILPAGQSTAIEVTGPTNVRARPNLTALRSASLLPEQ